MQQVLFQTKTTDELKEELSRQERRKEEAQATINDPDASPSYKEAAEETIADANREIKTLQTVVEARENTRSGWREKVKELF